MNSETMLAVFLVVLALEAFVTAALQFATWYSLRGMKYFRYFSGRAFLAGTAHVMEGGSLVALSFFPLVQVVVFGALLVWVLGELFKIIGEGGVAGNQWGIFNGVSRRFIQNFDQKIIENLGNPHAADPDAPPPPPLEVMVVNTPEVVIKGSIPLPVAAQPAAAEQAGEGQSVGKTP